MVVAEVKVVVVPVAEVVAAEVVVPEAEVVDQLVS